MGNRPTDVEAAVAAHNKALSDGAQGMKWAVPSLPPGFRFMSLGEGRPVGYAVLDLDCPLSGWIVGHSPGLTYQSNELFGEGLVLACPDISVSPPPKTVVPTSESLDSFEKNLLARVDRVLSGANSMFDHVEITTLLDLHARGFLEVVDDGRRPCVMFTPKAKAALKEST